MPMTSARHRAAVVALAAAIVGGPAQADPRGMWKRPNGDTVHVTAGSGRLMCRITKGKMSGLEMCNGMSGSGDTWRGPAMKHPDMPGFMSFNGTVSVAGNALSIKGCAIGQSVCDRETWTRVK